MQPSHSSPGTPDRGLNLPIQPRRPKLLAQLRQALCPRHYSRRDESLVQKAVRDGSVTLSAGNVASGLRAGRRRPAAQRYDVRRSTADTGVGRYVSHGRLTCHGPVPDAVAKAGLTKWGGPPCPPEPAGTPAPLILSQTRSRQSG